MTLNPKFVEMDYISKHAQTFTLFVCSPAAVKKLYPDKCEEKFE